MTTSSTFSAHVLDAGEMLSNRYRIEEHIGTGGMANVYRATDTWRGNLTLAIKVLHKEFAEDKMYVERFVREVQVLHAVDHPNVVKVFDISTSGRYIFFTMEFLAGQTLQQIIEHRRFQFDELASAIVQICDGLDAIHARNIIHRDIKPDNIMLTPEGTLKITDFGVAREKSSRLTTKNQKVGSIVYMAPEVWLGKTPTPAVDLYSLGVLLYELSTGHVPFEDEYPGTMMKLHLEGKAESPRKFQADIPDWLNDLILVLLAKSPEDRPTTEEIRNSIAHIAPAALAGITKLPRDNAKPEQQFTLSPEKPSLQPTRRKTYIFKLSATRIIEETEKAELQNRRPRRKATVVLNLPRRAAIVFEIEPPSRDIYYFGLFFASLQVFDGLLTSLGIERFGMHAEGNPFLRELMLHYGANNALLMVKLIAIGIVVMMTVIAKHLHWVKDLIGVLSCIYLCAAIIPWIYFLYVEQPFLAI